MNLRILPLFLFACGPIAVEPGATDSTGVPSTSTTDASSSSTSASPPTDLGGALADLPSPERPVDTDRDLRVFITSSHHRGDMRVDFMSIEATTPDEVCVKGGKAYWLAVAQHAPEVFAQRIALDC